MSRKKRWRFENNPLRVVSIILCFLFIACSQLNQKNPTKIKLESEKDSSSLTVRDLFRNPVSSYFQISPDGSTLAFLQPYQQRMNISLLKVEKINEGLEKSTRLTEVLDRDIQGFFWKGNNTIVFSRDQGGDENDHLYAVDIHSKKVTDLTPYPGVRAQMVDDLENIKSHHILVELNKRKKEIFDLFEIDTRSGKIKLIAENPGTFTRWLTDHKGQVRGAMAMNGVTTEFYYRSTPKKSFKKTFSTHFKNSVEPHFFTFDNKYIYASSNLDRDKKAIVKFDIVSGKEIEKVYERDDVDIEGLSFSKKRKILLAALFTTWKNDRHFFDSQMANIFAKVSKQLQNLEISFSHFDKGERKIIVRTYSDRSRGSYYLYDIHKDQLQKITDITPWLNESDLVAMNPISYPTRDGLMIQGYLTLPKGKKEKVPLIVHPHGGPWARDIWGYNPTVQWLASRGYGVFQMNFRGSTGYGRQFWQSSFKQWGKKMQDDITDGVNWLIEQNIADPKKVCIYGGSYGGYAVLAGLAFTPDLYACGVDYVGVSNLFTFMKSIPPYWKPYLEMIHEMVGNPETDKELMEAASPVFHVDRIKAPLFVVQGAKDPRVNIEESNQIVAALKRKGIKVPYLVKENEGHGFHNEENRFEFYEAMEKFLAQYLK